MNVLRLRYVQTVLKEGKPHYYFRRAGFPRATLPGLPGSVEFMRAYEKALKMLPNEIGADRTVPGSMKALAIAWCASSQFAGLRPESQRTYRRLLDGFLAEHGHKSVKNLQPRHLMSILDRMADTPAQANALRNVLRQMLQFAFERGWRDDNPARDVKKLRYTKKPFATWSEDDIAAFEARWPVGSRARLALALLLYTGQRRGDVIRMGPQHVQDGHIEVAQSKTGTRLAIPMHPDLQAAIAAHECGQSAFLVTQAGKPFSSGTAFYNWFRDCAAKAGIRAGLAPHGLRKAAARRLAEAGCTPHQIASITGHQTLAEVERYTKEANQKQLATAAIGHLGKPNRPQKRGTTENRRPPVSNLGDFYEKNQKLNRASGGAEGNRTPDLLIANEALSQLSYSPTA